MTAAGALARLSRTSRPFHNVFRSAVRAQVEHICVTQTPQLLLRNSAACSAQTMQEHNFIPVLHAARHVFADFAQWYVHCVRHMPTAEFLRRTHVNHQRALAQMLLSRFR